MDSFNLLKRRTTELFNSLPSSLPSLPSLPTGHSGFKGTWEKIQVPPLPRSGHTANIVSGTVYIFGGETDSPRRPTDNQMHAVILPSSGAQADYFAIKPKSSSTGETEPDPSLPTIVETTITDDSTEEIPLASPPTKGKSPSLPNVPSPRVGHASAVIGTRIFIFGGRSPSSSTPIDEAGRVWIFDTRTSLWSYLSPQPNTLFPSPRHFHSAVSTPKPNSFTNPPNPHPNPPLAQSQSWQEWARSTAETPDIGEVAELATDADSDGYGTLIIAGGILDSDGETDEVWAFDVRGKTWQRLPSLPNPAFVPALALYKSRLYHYAAGRLEYLELVVDEFNDKFATGEEVVLSSRDGGWKSFPVPNVTQEELLQHGPGERVGARLEAITVGGGREYLALIQGKTGKGGGYGDDVYVFQVPSQNMSIASATDTVLGVVKRGKTGEGKWVKVALGPEDDEDDESAEGPGGRAWIASTTMGELEENGIVVWGGKTDGEKVLGDGWVLRLG
ncbi:nitrile-specifier protein 2 [Podospora fimiseda]|uniref:Nitrile-specifier protein 2 n=1 Tax=Podospora fimiseda TaxID=252190 RepID=A0AAN7BNF7_9PEZI|nr:nitrile-specifier protein 2 [Podospora fimiseda]